MRFFSRRKPRPLERDVDRRRPENTELRRSIDLQQKQAIEIRQADTSRRLETIQPRIERLQRMARLLNLRRGNPT